VTVFHCTGGKDRTGVVAAVLLRALGVGDDEIVADYALSATFLEPRLREHRRTLARRKLAPDVIAYLTSSPPGRMVAMLRELDRRWGSTETYLQSIGVGDALVGRVRERLVR